MHTSSIAFLISVVLVGQAFPPARAAESPSYSKDVAPVLAANCAGCHSLGGGGGIGPALLDSEWIYGSDPASIHDTIVYGKSESCSA